MRIKRLMTMLFLSVFVVSLPVLTAAEGAMSVKGFGPRLGYGVNPDQFLIGGQAIMGKMFKIARLAPSIDAGFGDHATVVTFNADLQLNLFQPPGSNVKFYGLLGPTLAYIDPEAGNSDTEVGITIGGGIKMPMGSSNMYNLEARIGTGDIPDFKLMLGIYFGGASNKVTDKDKK